MAGATGGSGSFKTPGRYPPAEAVLPVRRFVPSLSLRGHCGVRPPPLPPRLTAAHVATTSAVVAASHRGRSWQPPTFQQMPHREGNTRSRDGVWWLWCGCGCMWWWWCLWLWYVVLCCWCRVVLGKAETVNAHAHKENQGHQLITHTLARAATQVVDRLSSPMGNQGRITTDENW